MVTVVTIFLLFASFGCTLILSLLSSFSIMNFLFNAFVTSVVLFNDASIFLLMFLFGWICFDSFPFSDIRSLLSHCWSFMMGSIL